MTDSTRPTVDWSSISLAEIVNSIRVSPEQPQRDINLATRALGYALSLHGWDGELITRNRVSMISLGGGKEESVLEWKGESLNAVGRPFSASLLTGAPVDVRTQSADKCLPPVIQGKIEALLTDISTQVQAFVLRQNIDPSAPSVSVSRPRI